MGGGSERRSVIDDVGVLDGDAEAVEPDIVPLARGKEPDRGDAEVAQDLRAEADLAPVALAVARCGMGLVAAERIARSAPAPATPTDPSRR